MRARIKFAVSLAGDAEPDPVRAVRIKVKLARHLRPHICVGEDERVPRIDAAVEEGMPYELISKVTKKDIQDIKRIEQYMKD